MFPWMTPVPPDMCIPSSAAEVRKWDDTDGLVVETQAEVLNRQETVWHRNVEESQASLTVVAPQLLEAIKSTYAIRDHRRTLSILQRSSYLVPVLLAIPAAVGHSFGEDCPLALEVDAVGDSPDDDELVVQIQSRLDPVDALERLAHFDDSWWLDRVPETKGKLTIGVEFV